jgi:hypothetical protein
MIGTPNQVENARKNIRETLEKWLYSVIKVHSYTNTGNLDTSSFNAHILDLSFIEYLKKEISKKAKSSKAWWVDELVSICFQGFTTFDGVNGLRVHFRFDPSSKTLTKNKMRWSTSQVQFIIHQEADGSLWVDPEYFSPGMTSKWFGCVSDFRKSVRIPQPGIKKKPGANIKKRSSKKEPSRSQKKMNNRTLSNIMEQLGNMKLTTKTRNNRSLSNNIGRMKLM